MPSPRTGETWSTATSWPRRWPTGTPPSAPRRSRSRRPSWPTLPPRGISWKSWRSRWKRRRISRNGRSSRRISDFGFRVSDFPNPRPPRQLREQLSRGQAADRVTPLRRDLGQRRQSETAPGQPRVRKDRVALASHEAPEVQDVHVDLSGSAREGGPAPDAAFHLLDGSEQGQRRTGPEDVGDGVPESPLPGVADRIGTVEGGHGPDRREALDFGESRRQVSPAVADVGAKAEVRGARGGGEPVSTPLRRAGRSRLPRPLRTRPRPRLLLLPRPGPPRRTRSGSLRGSAP